MLTYDRLDGRWITESERKYFRIFVPFHASITIGMGVIFLITKRVNNGILNIEIDNKMAHYNKNVMK